jgi:ABC-type transport system involved in multi-copper enzyme maturation permease subunit
VIKKFLNDPLLLKEVRTRMRSKTAVVVENLYIVGICGIVFWLYLVEGGFAEALGSDIGSTIFSFITYFQVLLMLAVGPLIAASAVTGEKEVKTFDSLCVAPLSASRIISVKVAASLGYFFMLILVSLPLVCMSFILGGVSPSDIFLAYVLTFLYTIVAGGTGIYWSTVFQRSIASIPAASICILVAIGVFSMLGNPGTCGIGMLSPMISLQALYSRTSCAFLGGQCAFWVVPVVMLPMIFVYCVLASVSKMRFARERRYVSLRAALLALLVTMVVFVIGSSLSGSTLDPWHIKQNVSMILGLLVGGVCFLAPWVGANLAVAQSEDDSARTQTGLVRCARQMMLNGPCFIFVLVLIIAWVFGLCLRTINPKGLNVNMVWAVYWSSVGVAGVAWALLGWRLANCTSKKRWWVSLVITYLIVAIVTIVPLVVVGAVMSNSEEPASRFVQYIALLSPGTNIAKIMDIRDFNGMFTIAKGNFATIQITTAIYAAFSLALILLRRKRIVKTRDGETLRR